MVISEIEQIFEPFIKKFQFEKTLGRFEQNFCIKNNLLYIEFFLDIRNNEISILVYKEKSNKGISILSLINKIKPEEYSDVFGFIKNEYLHLDDSLSIIKERYNENNSFFLLSICSILIKYYNQLRDVLEKEIL